jgi:hypothetical protein
MHVDIRLVKDYCAVGWRARKELDRLQPHLKTMSHPTHFGDEIPVSDG